MRRFWLFVRVFKMTEASAEGQSLSSGRESGGKALTELKKILEEVNSSV